MAKYRKKGQIDVYEKEKSIGCSVIITWLVIGFFIFVIIGSCSGN